MQTPLHPKFIQHTNYAKYIKALESLIYHIYRQKRQGKLYNLFMQEIQSEEGEIWLQNIIKAIKSSIKLLKKSNIRSCKKDFEKLKNTYLNLSGIYEKLIPLALGIIIILKGQGDADFHELNKRRLADIINKINSKYSKFKILTSGFNKTIRNAIAHSNIKHTITKNQLTFYSHKKNIDLPYSQFLSQTQDLFSLVLALLNLINIYACCIFQLLLKEQEKSIK